MRLILAALILAVTALPAAAQESMKFDGVTRQYFLEPPEGPRQAPAIIVLHGAATVPSRMRRIAMFTLHKKGWAEIYPVGLDRHWNDGRTGPDGRALSKADDLGFLRALIDKLAGQGLIDPARVYFAGVSNGGGMVFRVICEAPKLAAGAAVVAMNLPKTLSCQNGPPVPLLLIEGTADPVVPFGGGEVRFLGARRGRVLSARNTAAIFAVRNGCGAFDTIPIPDIYPGDGTRVEMHAYRGCTAPLRQYIVEGGGHTWPGNYNHHWVERELGTTSRDISATSEIEDFFTELNRR